MKFKLNSPSFLVGFIKTGRVISFQDVASESLYCKTKFTSFGKASKFETKTKASRNIENDRKLIPATKKIRDASQFHHIMSNSNIENALNANKFLFSK
jgi:hypothetical protein